MAEEPTIYLPTGYEANSGLIVPTSVQAAEQVELPKGLRFEPRAVAVGRPTSFLDQVGAYATQDELGLPSTSVEEIVGVFQSVPFRATMRMLSRFQRDLWAARLDQAAQLALAKAWFGSDSLFVERGIRFLGGHSRHLLFTEQQFFAAEKLTIVYAKDDDRTDLTDDEYRALLIALISIPGTLLGPQIERLDQENLDPHDAAWLRFFLGHGGLIGRGRLKHELARADRLYRVLAEASEAKEHPSFVSIHELLLRTYGFSFAQLQAVAFALYAGSKIGDPKEIPVVIDKTYFDKASPKFDAGRALDVLSADRDWFRQRILSSADNDRRFAFDITPFLRKPALREGAGLLPIAPRAVEAWLGATGAYYRLLDAARARGDVGSFATFNGALVELYARSVVQRAHRRPKTSTGLWVAGEVYGEQPYQTSQGKALTPDIAIDLTPDLVLFEVTSSRTTVGSVIDAEPDAVRRDLAKVLFGKVEQFADATTAITSGHASIGDVSIQEIDRVWPIVVTDQNLLQSPVLWAEIRASLPQGLKAPKVMPLTILDLEDLEHLMELVQRGESLVSILNDKTSEQWRELEFGLWYQERARA
jgi:hypothetical protein